MKNILLYLSLSFLVFFGCNQSNTQGQSNTNEPKKSEEKHQIEKIVPKWGKHFYKAHDGKTEAIEHIWLRHNYNSTYNNVSRFGKNYSSRQAIKQLITQALEKATDSDIQEEAGGQKTVTVTMDKPTGLSQKGSPTNKIRIHLDKKDFVKTAYPY